MAAVAKPPDDGHWEVLAGTIRQLGPTYPDMVRGVDRIRQELLAKLNEEQRKEFLGLEECQQDLQVLHLLAAHEAGRKAGADRETESLPSATG